MNKLKYTGNVQEVVDWVTSFADDLIEHFDVAHDKLKLYGQYVTVGDTLVRDNGRYHAESLKK